MTVLSDVDIARELGYGDLDVSPVNLEEQLQPNSLDIRLGTDFSFFAGYNAQKTIDPKQEIQEEDVLDYSLEEKGAWIDIDPDDFVLAETIESFQIPNYLYAELKGRSSLARLGIEIHSTGGVIDSSFCGDIVLEISNNNRRPIRLYPGMRIAQVVFHELSSKCNNPYSEKDNKYQNQEGVVHSRINEEL